MPHSLSVRRVSAPAARPSSTSRPLRQRTSDLRPRTLMSHQVPEPRFLKTWPLFGWSLAQEPDGAADVLDQPRCVLDRLGIVERGIEEAERLDRDAVGARDADRLAHQRAGDACVA